MKKTNTTITRRDLINGALVGSTSLAFAPITSLTNAASLTIAQPIARHTVDSTYPPILTGLRGSHEGSFEVAHALAWAGEKPSTYVELEEHYDLVVVGAGMSGLATAWFYRKKIGPDAQILIIDNHDDFGGHAKRNEFHYQDKMLLSLGGAQNLDSPSNYGDIAGSVLRDIGIDEAMIEQMAANTPDNYILGGKLGGDVGLSMCDGDESDRVTIAGHWLQFFHGRGDYKAAVRSLPIETEQQDRLIEFFGGERDFLADLWPHEKWHYVNSTSYNQFLVEQVSLAPRTLPILDAHLLILNGPSGWNHTVLEALLAGCPGLRGMGWLSDFIDTLGALVIDDLAGDVRMFPDGNASVARLLVQKMIPRVAPQMQGVEDVAIARFDYSALDLPNNTTRLRLNSTVVGVKEVSGSVQIDYVKKGTPETVRAEHCILACNNNIIPHLCPEMSETQKEGLQYGERAPFVYANVLLDNGRAFKALGSTFLQCPYDPFQWVSAGPTMTTGGYTPPQTESDPMVVFMMASPTPADGTKGTTRELFRQGRRTILAASFADYEHQIREQLQSMLGPHGFSHEDDIQAITVNRIPHGYAYWYQGLDDPEWADGQAPHEVGRQQFGRISIANSDSEVTPLMNAAFEAAHRAVEEQTL